MRLLVQRVSYVKLYVSESLLNYSKRGFLVFIGFSKNDLNVNLDLFINKSIKQILNLKIFDNLSLKDINGDFFLVSQFTLYASLKKNNKLPSFHNALNFEDAKRLYDYFLQILKNNFENVYTGIFGSLMQIEFLNEGPYTLILENESI